MSETPRLRLNTEEWEPKPTQDITKREPLTPTCSSSPIFFPQPDHSAVYDASSPLSRSYETDAAPVSCSTSLDPVELDDLTLASWAYQKAIEPCPLPSLDRIIDKSELPSFASFPKAPGDGVSPTLLQYASTRKRVIGKEPIRVMHEAARKNDLYKNALPGMDGLYHCPWEGQKGCDHTPDRLKCIYDKYLDSHIKPYSCHVCDNTRFSSIACLLRHEREAHGMHGHGERPYLCPAIGCERSAIGKGFPRLWNLRDHVRRLHKEWDNAGLDRMYRRPKEPKEPRQKSVKRTPRKNTVDSSHEKLVKSWNKEKQTLEGIVEQLDDSPGPKSSRLIKRAQRHLKTMKSLSMSLSMPEGEILLSGDEHDETED